MQIGLDLRFLKDNLYSSFITSLIENLIIQDTKNKYRVYINTNCKQELLINRLKKYTKCDIKIIEINNFSIKEQIHFLKILKNDKNDLMIFFNHFKPIFYRGDYYTFVLNLKDIYYGNFESSFNKYRYLYLLEKNLQKSQKIICFDENTKNELVERFNIREDTIKYIHGFFKDINLEKELDINIKIKYSIQNDYLLYSCGDGIEKNLEKLVQIYDKVEKNIDLIIIGDKISKNIFLRNKIVNLGLQDRIKFLSPIKDSEKPLIYKQSIGVVFPSLYETFPFCLSDAIKHDTPIITSNIKSLENIFGDKVDYFSPISKVDMLKKINNYIKKENKTADYSEIRNNLSINKTAQELIDIIN